MRCSFGRGCFQRKLGADVGSRIYDEPSVRRPRRISCILLNKKNRSAAVDGYIEKVRHAVIVRRRRDRFAVGCPRGAALKVQRIVHYPCVCSILAYHVQQFPPTLLNRKRYKPPVGRNRRATYYPRPLIRPQLCPLLIGELPDTFARIAGGDEQKVVRTEPRRKY